MVKDEFHIAGQPNSIDDLKGVGSQDALHVKAMSYNKYFGEMEISEADKEKRISTAEVLESVFLFLFALILASKNNGIEYTKEELVSLTTDKYKQALKSVNIDVQMGYNYLVSFINESVDNVVAVTLRNLSNAYFISSERAKVLAEEESNSLHNKVADRRAMIQGATHKKWVTLKDDKVRHTHRLVDETVIAINDRFVVGDSLMAYPRDLSGEVKEIANCRCSCKYLKNGKEINTDKEVEKQEQTFLSSLDELTIR